MIAALLTMALSMSVLSGCSGKEASQPAGGPTAQTPQSPQEEHEPETEPSLSLDDVLSGDWAYLCSWDASGWRLHVTDSEIQTTVGRIMPLKVQPRDDIPSDLLEELNEDRVSIELESRNTDILTILEGNAVLFKNPGTAELLLQYEINGYSNTKVVTCKVVDQEGISGCRLENLNTPNRTLTTDDGTLLVPYAGSGTYFQRLYFGAAESYVNGQLPKSSKNLGSLENLCTLDGRVFYSSADRIYLLAPDYQSSSVFYEAEGSIQNLFAADGRLCCVTEHHPGECSFSRITPEGKAEKSSSLIADFDSMSFLNGVIYFIGSPLAGEFAGQKSVYCLDLHTMEFYQAGGERVLNYNGKTFFWNGKTYTLKPDQGIYESAWGDEASGTRIIADVEEMVLHDGSIYYIRHREDPFDVECLRYDLATKEQQSLFKSDQVNASLRLCVEDDSLYLLGVGKNLYHVDLPVYHFSTGEIDFWTSK